MKPAEELCWVVSPDVRHVYNPSITDQNTDASVTCATKRSKQMYSRIRKDIPEKPKGEWTCLSAKKVQPPKEFQPHPYYNKINVQ